MRVLMPFVLGAAYYAGSVIGFAFTFGPRPVSVLWLPNAILFGALVLTPGRHWWRMLAAALVAHVAAQIDAGVPLPMSLCWYVSNSAEALIGAGILRRFGQQPFRLDRIAHVVLFAAAVFVSVTLSSFLDAAFVLLNDWGSSGYWTVWRSRTFANTLTQLALVPAIIGLGSVRIASLRTAPRARLLEGILFAALVVITSLYAFGHHSVGPDTTTALLYIPLPLLLWGALRFGPAAAGAAVFTTVVVATANAVHGRGPFASPSAEANALEIQLLFSVVAATMIALGAVLEERQRMQSSTWRRTEQLRLAVGAAQMRSWDLAIRDDRLLTRSPDLYRPLERVLGRIHPADRIRVARAFRRSLRAGNALDVEFRVARPDGNIRWIHGLGRALHDRKRGEVRVVGLSADITDRKLAEALNRGESHILQMIATGAPLSSILTSIVRLIESESLGLACSILVLDRDGIHAHHLAAPSLPESYVRAIDGLAIGPDAGSCGTAMYLRKPVHTRDIREDPRWSNYRDLALKHGLRSCWSSPILSGGTVLGSFAMYYRYPRHPSAREVQLVELATHLAVIAIERQRSEFDLSEQRIALAHLGRLAVLGELSGTLAHELSQPLAAILSEAQAARRLLNGGSPREAELAAIMDEIITAERHAARVIDGVRSTLARRSRPFKPVDLNRVVADTFVLMRSDLAARDIAVVPHLAAGLPSIQGDHVQLQQVLLNLCLNACDAMAGCPPAERIITIITRRSADDDFVELAVTDYGTGISGDQIRQIFDPFVTSKDHGLGLGLAICRSIIRAHGGGLTATNNHDRGATFVVRLPIAAHVMPAPARDVAVAARG